MFNNGKSSSNAKKGAPDLVFSESRFLRAQPSTAGSTDNPVGPLPDVELAQPVIAPHAPMAFVDGSSKFFADHDKTLEQVEPIQQVEPVQRVEPVQQVEPECYYQPPCYARGETPVDLLLLAQPTQDDVMTPYEEVVTEEDDDDDASLGYTMANDSTMPDLRHFWQQRRAY